MSHYRSHLANGYTAELSAIISRAVALGYTLPSSAKLIACNNLIKSMKADGAWSLADAYFVFGYNDTALSDFSRINWKNPSATLATFNGGLTYLTTGIKGDNVNGYCDTGFAPNNGVNYTLNSAGRLFVVSVARSAGNYFDGNVSGTLNNGSGTFSTTNTRINSTNGLAVAADLSGTGLKAVLRDSSSAVRVINTSTVNSTTQTSVSVPTTNQFILRGISAQYSNAGISNYWMGGSLTNTQVANFRTYYNTFLTAMGLTALA